MDKQAVESCLPSFQILVAVFKSQCTRAFHRYYNVDPQWQKAGSRTEVTLPLQPRYFKTNSTLLLHVHCRIT